MMLIKVFHHQPVIAGRCKQALRQLVSVYFQRTNSKAQVYHAHLWINVNQEFVKRHGSRTRSRIQTNAMAIIKTLPFAIRSLMNGAFGDRLRVVPSFDLKCLCYYLRRRNQCSRCDLYFRTRQRARTIQLKHFCISATVSNRRGVISASDKISLVCSGAGHRQVLGEMDLDCVISGKYLDEPLYLLPQNHLDAINPTLPSSLITLYLIKQNPTTKKSAERSVTSSLFMG